MKIVDKKGYHAYLNIDKSIHKTKIFTLYKKLAAKAAGPTSLLFYTPIRKLKYQQTKLWMVSFR